MKIMSLQFTLRHFDLTMKQNSTSTKKHSFLGLFKNIHFVYLILHSVKMPAQRSMPINQDELTDLILYILYVRPQNQFLLIYGDCQ